LKRGATAHCVYLGAGYYLRYFLHVYYWKHSMYGLRVLVSTWLHTLSGRGLPGFLGDTVFQSRRRLGDTYRAHGLVLVRDVPSPTFLGLPVFIYHLVQKCA